MSDLPGRKPEWLKKTWRPSEEMQGVEALVEGLGLNTVCREASCPNYSECFSRGTATFMILGAVCTRNCSFCGVTHSGSFCVGPEHSGDGSFCVSPEHSGDGSFCVSPVDPGEPARVAEAVEHTGDGSFCVSPVDPGEPARVAEAVKRLGLGYVVITSVTRDDLEDGGAGQFAKTVECIRQLSPGTKVEVLIPDFCGNTAALDAVICSGPDVIAHNMETVRELYEKVRPQADYDRSLEVLRHIASRGEGNNGGKGPEGDNGPEGGQLPEGGKGPDSGKGIKCKSGVMAGVGETEAQMLRLMDDLREAGCAFLTIGQYLRPSPDNIPVEKYIEPEVFEHWAEEARARGFEFVASAPFVRSSYHAEEWTRAAAARETADEETQV